MAQETTAEKVVAALEAYKLKDKGHGKYRCNSPFRPGSNSHAFTLLITDDEYGTWYDHVSGEHGSLYELAEKLGIDTPKQNGTPKASPRTYQNLADYAASHGVDVSVFRAAGWRDAFWYGKRALAFPTPSGTRYRLLEGDDKYIQEKGYKACLYGLEKAIELAPNQPIILCNGEASVVVAQHHGMPAFCQTLGEKPLTADNLKQLLSFYRGPILVVFDCDKAGRETAPKLVSQLQDAGYDARAIDLGFTDGFDLADFCRLYDDQAKDELAQCKELTTGEPTKPTSSKKQPPSSGQIREALAALGYTFRYNQVALTMEVNGEPISDALEATIRMHMRDKGYKNMGAVADVYTAWAHENAYHPVRDYLDSLEWDGQPHIATFAKHFTCIDEPITYTDGKQQGLFYTYLYRWMIGAVAKVYERAQNMMLVIVGPQDIGKSTVAEWLCSPLPDYFLAQAIQADNKDSMLRLAQNFIWEVDELDGTIRKSDVAALKAFITRDGVVERPAYARRDVRVPALASLIGTVNKGAGFLADATGNRRFYVAEVSRIDWNYTKVDVSQMWAQAVDAYKHGVAWKLSPCERAAQTATNKGHEVRTLLDDWIDTDLRLDGGPDVGMTAADIVEHLRSREHFLSGSGRAQAMEVAEALLKRGITRKQSTIDGLRAMYYLGVTRKVY